VQAFFHWMLFIITVSCDLPLSFRRRQNRNARRLPLVRLNWFTQNGKTLAVPRHRDEQAGRFNFRNLDEVGMHGGMVAFIAFAFVDSGDR
jgi:hypothetical protein